MFYERKKLLIITARVIVIYIRNFDQYKNATKIYQFTVAIV